MDYKAELKITVKLRTECIKLFNQCDEFESPRKLRSFASVSELKLVVECIERSETIDYNGLINNLLRKRGASKEPVLLDLLDALAVVYQEDTKGSRFKELKEEIRIALSATEGAEQEKEQKNYQMLVEANPQNVSSDLNQLAHQWIDQADNNLDELSLRLTLAVFNGTSFEAIERAKEDLLESLQELAPKSKGLLPDPPSGPMMRRLLAAGANESEGKPPDWRRVIELERPELAIEAVSYAWKLNRDTEWRKTLIAWLTRHAANHPADVRARAAVAVGRLAVKDYRFIRDNLLSLWVEKDDAQYRTAIGMALGVLVRDEVLTTEVQELLYRWAHSTEPRERWAAMRSYIYVGAYCQPINEAIVRWREIAASERVAVRLEIEGTTYVLNNPLHMSLVDAMVKFFVLVAQMPTEERRQRFEGILEGLKTWIAAKDDDTGLGIFMFCTLGRMFNPTTNGEDTSNPPVLLQLIEEQPSATEYRTQLARLFELSMRTGLAILEVRDILCGWFRWVDSHPNDSQRYEPRLRVLLQDILIADGSGKARGKLIASLHSCGRNRTAERILATL